MKQPLHLTLKQLFAAIRGFFWTWSRAALKAPENGGFVVTEGIFDSRIVVCRACPKYVPEADMCGVCFCKMDVKAKLIEAVCPEHKW